MVLENAAGEVMFSKEQDIYEQISRLDRRIDNWQEALPDLNGRMKKLEEVLGQAVEESKKQTAKFREIQLGVDNVMKVSARVEGEFLGRLLKLEQASRAAAEDLLEHQHRLMGDRTDLDQVKGWQGDHPKDHTCIMDEIVKLEAATKLMNETINDVLDRLMRSEASYNKLLEFTDQKMVRHDQRFAALEAGQKGLKEKEIEELAKTVKDLQGKYTNAMIHVDNIESAMAAMPPSKIPVEDNVPLPTVETVRCKVCKHATSSMDWEFSGYRVGAKGCDMVLPSETVFFRGVKCKHFEERE